MKKLLIVFVAAVLGGLVALGGAGLLNSDVAGNTQEKQEMVFPAKFVNATTGDRDGNISDVDFTYAAEKTLPAVVHIRSSVRANPMAQGGQGFDFRGLPEPFRDFFRRQGPPQQAPQERLQQASGSGVIISPEGYIVTNNHVVAEAEELEVTLNDKRTYKAKVIGLDPSTDIALIKIEAEGLPVIRFADSDVARVGEWVLAVGNPFNLASTVTAGIVSAKGRNINIMQDQAPIESFIQTDAVVNPGNSGGALVNLNGDLIGINTAIATPTGVYAGYAFAVPSKLVGKVVKDLKEYGVVQRAYLGVMIRGLDGNFAKEKGLDITEGVYVDDMMESSAAAEAGIQPGDVIIEVDGAATKNSPELTEIIGRHRPGDKVQVTVLRDGKKKAMTVVLKNKAGNTGIVEKSAPAEKLNALGAGFETVDGEKAKSFGISGGVQLSALRPGSMLSQTGIREGFVITKVDKVPVRTVEDLKQILAVKEGGVMLEGIYPGSSKVYYYAFGLS